MHRLVITFGEIMMRLSTPGFSRFSQAESFRIHFGGAEVNVGISLAHMGLSAAHVTRLPDNDLGRSVVQYLRRHHVDTSFIRFGEDRLGLYFFENGSMQRSPKVIYDRSYSAFANLQPKQIDWNVVMQRASWFHWSGITPAVSQSAADACFDAIGAARRYGVPVSGDINYRRNLWQYGKKAVDVMPALIEGTDYLVAGEVDIANCLGISADDFATACESVMRSYPAVRKIACTRRQIISANHHKISGILCDGKSLAQSATYELAQIVDRIGAGDAFMAGLIYGWSNGYDDRAAVEFATAACALKHSIEGDANLVTVNEVEELIRNENTGKLLR